jgi:hypothetical protein
MRVEPDRLGVAAALEVEHALVRPAVLVVADQRPLRVGRQRRLARPREPEEQRDPAVRVVVRRAVHREDAAQREHEVERPEDRLLDLAGVLGVGDQHEALAVVDRDRGAAARSVPSGVGLERRQGQHGPSRRPIGLALAHEQVADEERVPGALGHDPDRHLRRGVGAGVQLLDEEPLPTGGVEHLLLEVGEVLWIERLVHRAPVDQVLGDGVADHELVLRRAARELAGVGDERPALRDRRPRRAAPRARTAPRARVRHRIDQRQPQGIGDVVQELGHRVLALVGSAGRGPDAGAPACPGGAARCGPSRGRRESGRDPLYQGASGRPGRADRQVRARPHQRQVTPRRAVDRSVDRSRPSSRAQPGAKP